LPAIDVFQAGSGSHLSIRAFDELDDGQAVGTSGGSGVEVGGREVAGDRRKRLVERAGFLAFAVDLVIPKVAENRGDRNAPGRGLAEVPAAVAIKMGRGLAVGCPV
jgi:hypothetical protein